jgi:hypothetical protein
MQQNPGFMILYSFIKDSLLSKVGIVKVWWEEREEETRETYYDITDDQFMMLVQAVQESDGALQIVEHTIHDGSDEIEDESRRREPEPPSPKRRRRRGRILMAVGAGLLTDQDKQSLLMPLPHRTRAPPALARSTCRAWPRSTQNSPGFQPIPQPAPAPGLPALMPPIATPAPPPVPVTHDVTVVSTRKLASREGARRSAGGIRNRARRARYQDVELLFP